jgi:putative oxidoreductase
VSQEGFDDWDKSPSFVVGSAPRRSTSSLAANDPQSPDARSSLRRASVAGDARSDVLAHLYWKFEILPGGVHGWWSGLLANGYARFVPWYSISAEIAGALLLIPGICTRWVSLYALPLTIGASHFWLVRNGFDFTAAGAELPLVWSIMLLLQVMLGDGPFSVGWVGRLRWMSRRDS